MTNFEKIKNMSIDELVEKLDKLADCEHCSIRKFCDANRKIINCKSVWRQWLKSEASHGQNLGR